MDVTQRDAVSFPKLLERSWLRPAHCDLHRPDLSPDLSPDPDYRKR